MPLFWTGLGGITPNLTWSVAQITSHQLERLKPQKCIYGQASLLLTRSPKLLRGCRTSWPLKLNKWKSIAFIIQIKYFHFYGRLFFSHQLTVKNNLVEVPTLIFNFFMWSSKTTLFGIQNFRKRFIEIFIDLMTAVLTFSTNSNRSLWKSFCLLNK